MPWQISTCVYLELKRALGPYVSRLWEEDVVFYDYAPFCFIMFPVCVVTTGPKLHACEHQTVCVRKWCKTFLGDICIGTNLHSRSPCGYVASALCWSLLPGKTQSFKRLGAFTVLLHLFFFMYSSPFLFLCGVSCSFFPLSPFQSGPALYAPNPISFLVLSSLSTSPLWTGLVFIECSYRSWRIWVK